MKINLTVELPSELAQEFMQVLRDFDTKHDPEHQGIVKFSALLEGEMTAEEATAMLQGITPTPEVPFCQEDGFVNASTHASAVSRG